MKKKHRRVAGLAAMAAGAVAGAGAQEAGAVKAAIQAPPPKPAGSSSVARLGLSASADGWFPTLIDGQSDVSYAMGGTAQVSFAALPFLEALGRAGVYSMRLASNESLLYIGGSGGLGLTIRLMERLSVGLSGFAGLGRVPYGESSLGLYELGARLETSFRLSAAMTLGLSAGYERLANPNAGTFLDAISAGLRLKLSPAETGRDRVNLVVDKVETQAVFPVFRAWYDAEPLGSVTLRNGEDGPVENVRVSFFAPEYMGGPRLCTTIARLERGQSVTVPLYAVFDERILSLTENGATSAEIDVQYSFLGSRRESREGLTLSLHHRNAMSWEDDRRAAAFVSPTDPAALWFSRYASSVVRDRMRSELPANMQFALGIFESLKLYGLNYVIDPNSSYIDMSENAAVVDYLQYPSQTLMYRGGDCDDLSILYCSLLESSGIATAFITIPGHIFMAFDLGLSEAEARDAFFDPGLLVFRDGRAWAPIEITMVKDGFVKAWRVGAKQWIDNDRAGTAAFFAMRNNWAKYKPSGLQDAAARFTLPDEARAMAAFDAAVDRFVARELEPVVAEYEKKLASSRTPETLNEYGMAMAKVGMLDSAWERFVEASKAGYAWAWNNLASVAFVRKDYALAYSYYEWTTTLLPGDPVAVLGMARCAYELDRYSESAILYEGLRIEAPALAVKYGYLASAYGGSGRAWSMADRLANSVWSKPGLSFDLPVSAAAPAVAAAPPPATPTPSATPAILTLPVAPAAQDPIAPPAGIVAAPESTPETAEPKAEDTARSGLVPAPGPEAAAELGAAQIAQPASIVAAPEAQPLGPSEATADASDIVAAPSSEPAPAIVSAPEAELTPAIVSAPEAEPTPAIVSVLEAEPAPAIVSVPETAPAPAIVSVPEAAPAPAIVSVSEAAPAPAIVSVPEAAPAPKPEQAPVAAAPEMPRASATVQALAAARAQPQDPKAPAASAKPALAIAPPSVVDKPPEDVEIAAKALEAAAFMPPPEAIAPPPVIAPSRPVPVSVAAPPAVVDKPPVDAEIAAKASEASSVAAQAAAVMPPLSIEPAQRAGTEPAPAIVLAPPPPAEPAITPAAVIVSPPPAVEQAPAVVALPPASSASPSPVVASPSVTVAPPPASPSVTVAPPAPSAPLAATARPGPAYAPASRYVRTAEPGGAPAFGKRLPDEADASAYVPLPAPREAESASAPAAEVAPGQAASAAPAAKAEPASIAIDLSGPLARVANGSWKASGAAAAMTDGRQMYAKLAVATPGLTGAAAYGFKARARGEGWVGFGLHIHGRGSWKLSGYGGGDSILIWITSDPKAYGDAAPRLQVYRSRGEVDMTLVAQARVSGSAFELRDYRVEYDPGTGLVEIFVDGLKSLSASGLKNPGPSDYAALRALDLAEFSDFSITPLHNGPDAVEKTP